MRRGEGGSLIEDEGDGSSGIDVMRCCCWSCERVVSSPVVVTLRTGCGLVSRLVLDDDESGSRFVANVAGGFR